MPLAFHSFQFITHSFLPIVSFPQAWGSGAPPSSLFSAAQKAKAGTPPPPSSNHKGGRGGGTAAAGRGPGRGGTPGGGGGRHGGGHRKGGRGHHGNDNSNNHHSHSNNHSHKTRRGSKDHKDNSHPHHGGGGRGGGGGDNKKKGGGGGGPKQRRAGITPWDEIVLFHTRGSGDTDAERAVQRRSMAAFLSCRMNYLDPPASWTPHEKCLWKDPAENGANDDNDTSIKAKSQPDGEEGEKEYETTTTPSSRIEQIEAQMKVLWHFKPLEVNEETRWKARSIEGTDTSQDDTEEKIRKATGILNKLSWTTLDRLTVKFLKTIGDSKNTDGGEAVFSKEIVEQSMHLIIDKAMTEPHFAELYAGLCSKLCGLHKSFKKTLLAQCQAQFEENDREESLENLPENPAEREYQLTILRKKYVGLMQFIGELYKNKVIKGAIMISCLERLFMHTDEEKLECFTKLMTTIGERLHAHEDEPEMHKLWDHVYSMADRTPPDGKKVVDDLQAPNTRIKFLMQDLIDLKESGWVQRRPTLKAKKISDIHAEVAEEEAAAAAAAASARRPSKSGMMRSQSGGSLRSSQQFPSSNSLSSQNSSGAPPPPPDGDGFTPVAKPKKAGMRRVQSDGGGPSSLQKALGVGSSGASSNQSKREMPAEKPSKVYPKPEDCAKKMKSLLKEYFVGGDTADAALSVDELIGKGNDGDVARGKAVVEAAVLMMMEGKESEVEKMLTLFEAAGEKIPPESFVGGLKDPVEFLRDIEIDAPLAPNLLAMILANWFSKSYLPSMLKFFVENDDLEDFRERSDETRAAEFCRQVIQKRGGPLTQDDLETVTHLMTDEERLMHPEVRSWIGDI